MKDDMQGQETMECENHPGQSAVGACAVCGKPVCGDCALRSDTAIVCDRPEHQTILSDWSTVFTCESEFEADAVQRNLENAGMDTRLFSARDHVSLYWTLQRDPVRLMVHRNAAEKANAVLAELELDNGRAQD